MNSRDRFLNACHSQPVDHPPVWVMRQAGRYLPEYRALREKYSFLEMVKTPELAREITLQPLARFSLDAAIIFSDILVVPEAMGQPYEFNGSKGIKMSFALDSIEKIERISITGVAENLSYVGEAIRLTRETLGKKKALLGFGGAPWTLASYMVEGESTKDFSKIKSLAYAEPLVFETLMEKLTAALIDYFKLQIASGVDAIQIFDSWGSMCPASHYWEFSLKWIEKIINALPTGFPIILYAKGMSHLHKLLIKTNPTVLAADWTMPLSHLRKNIPDHYAIQGNLDPIVLNTTPEIVREEVMKILHEMEQYNGFIFNLGHGITPMAKIENMQMLTDTIANFRSQ